MAAKPWLKFIVERMSHIGFYQFLEEDFIKLNDRIRHYMDWSVNEIHFLALKEVHDIFKVMELFCNFFCDGYFNKSSLLLQNPLVVYSSNKLNKNYNIPK